MISVKMARTWGMQRPVKLHDSEGEMWKPGMATKQIDKRYMGICRGEQNQTFLGAELPGQHLISINEVMIHGIQAAGC